jgi:peptidylprolyl isomerase
MGCRLRVLAVLGLVAVGCDAPRLVPVAPPGLEYTQVTPDQEEEPAEALGESRVAQGIQGSVNPNATPKGAELARPMPPVAEPTETGQSRTTASGLTYETLKPGSGDQATAGKTAVVHYTGTLTNGTQFDSSRGKQPYPVTIGVSSVIPGWHEGLAGMKVGEVRKLTIPPELAYGDSGRPPVIPPKATLVFEVELMEVR